MRSFTRLLSALAFLLSVNLVVNALPSSHRSGLIAHRQYETPEPYNGKVGKSNYYESGEYSAPNNGGRTGHNGVDIQGEVWTLKGKLDTKLALLGKSKNIDDAKAGVETIVEIIKEECSRLADVSMNIPVEAQHKIAHVVIKVFITLVSICAKLSLKFGAPLVINLLTEIDAAFSGYLLVLTGCVPGLSQVLMNLAGNVNGDFVSDIRVAGMVQCVKLLGLGAKIPGVSR